MNNYEKLGIDPGSSEEQIKAAWKKLVKQNHPDLHPDDPDATERVAKINAAYDALLKGDTGEEEFEVPNEDTIYEFYRANGRGGFAFSQGFRSFGNANVSAVVRIELKDLIAGKEIDVFYNCPCVAPDGSRIIEHRNKKIKIDCDTPVDRPLVFKGEGVNIHSNFPPGDLHVNLIVHGDDEHQINGVDIHMARELSLVDAVVGTDFIISTMDNKKIKITVPPGTQSGTMFKVTGKGFKLTHGRADMFVHAKVNIPEITDSNAAEQFKSAMAKIGLI
jgi:DnaJ-class molecular chaperone